MSTKNDGHEDTSFESDPSNETGQAATAAQQMKLKQLMHAYTTATDELRLAIQHAVYDEGVSWASVEEALGIGRGVAYLRFRRKPGAPS